MKNGLLAALLILCCLGSVQVGFAEELTVKAGDTLQTLLEGKKGKRVTVRLLGGEEMTGRVKFINKELVQLGELSGREFYDAVIDMNKVSAIVVRTKE